MNTSVRIGVIGGSGLYHMDGLSALEELHIDTPFGAPSDTIRIGEIDGVRLAFLPRHGRGHTYDPSGIPAQANIWAMKSLGVEYLLSVSAVGSLREHIAPTDIVIPNQIVDRTIHRPRSFFGKGFVAHIGFAEPFCPWLSSAIAQNAKTISGLNLHEGGSYICIEGPQFSSKAESALYRQWGMDIIGMTAIPEAKLAREAEMCYAIIACVTDYDCWHESEEHVTVDLVIRNLNAALQNAQQLIRAVLPMLHSSRDAHHCPCPNALSSAVITEPSSISAEMKLKYRLLLEKYPDFR